jgi:O-antigen/teichoic acid export membrane protein
MSYLRSQQQWNKIVQHIHNILKLLGVIYVWLVVLLFAFPETVISTLFSDTYLPSAPYLRIMAVLPLILGILPVFTLSLISLGYPWRALTGLAFQLGTLLLPLLLLNTHMDLFFMSLVTLCSAVIGTVIQGMQVGKLLHHSIIPAMFIKLAAFGFIAAIVLRLWMPYLGTSLSAQYILTGTIYSLFYVVFVWVLFKSLLPVAPKALTQPE